VLDLFNIGLDGIADFITKLESFKELIPELAAAFLREQAERFVSVAKQITPVDTGAMRDSYVIHDAEVDEVLAAITIENTAEYASFVNYGTVYILPRYFWTKSVNLIRHEIQNNYAAYIAVKFEEHMAA